MLSKIWAYVTAFFSFLWNQMWGTWENIKDVFTEVKPDDVIIPAFYDTLVWFFEMFPKAVGTESPQEQIYASIVLGVFTFFTGILTGGAAWVIIGVWGITLLIGVIRLIPFANRQSERSQGIISRIIDWFRRLLLEW